MNNFEVAQRWIVGNPGRSAHMFTDGTTIYSYGAHFPMAYRHGQQVYRNKDRHSRSTSKHQCLVQRVIPSGNKPIEVSTAELKRIIESKGRYRPDRRWWRLAGWRKLAQRAAEIGVVLNRCSTVRYGEVETQAHWDRQPNGQLAVAAYFESQYRPWLYGTARKRVALSLHMENIIR